MVINSSVLIVILGQDIHSLVHKFSMKFYTYIKKYFPSKFSIILKLVEFRLDDFQMFINTLWYDNVDDYKFFRLKNVLTLKIYLDYLVFF
jgi:hypothetical protein